MSRVSTIPTCVRSLAQQRGPCDPQRPAPRRHRGVWRGDIGAREKGQQDAGLQLVVGRWTCLMGLNIAQSCG